MSGAAMPLGLDLELRRHTLANGLRVVLHRDRAQPLVTVNLWYHVGSKNEAPGKTGLAHLFEHMLFQGSAHVGTNDHFRLVQLAGGSGNGSTWFDRTNYYETLPSSHLDLGLWLESDRMGFLLPAMTQQKLDTQREVVVNERRQRIDNQPYGRAFERLHETLYAPGHPYRWPVIGYMEDLATATLDDVAAFFATHYAPNNAVLTLAGDLPADALERIERYFGEIPAGPPVERPRIETRPPEAERRVVLPDRVTLPRLYLGYQTPAFGEPGWYAADLLTTALVGGKTSRLWADLVYRRQLAQEVSCFALPLEEAATFVVVATARPGVEPERLLAALDEHLDRVAQAPLAEAEVEQARRRHATAFYDQLQSIEARADLIGGLATLFDAPERLATEIDRYAAVDAAAIQALAASALRRDRRAVVSVVPEETA